jgi:hypothetical protein
MKELPKRVVIGSMVVAGIVALMALVDMFLKFPFSGNKTVTMDILYLVCAAIVIYLCWDSLRDLN